MTDGSLPAQARAALLRTAVVTNRAVVLLAAAAMAALPVMLFYDVTARYLFNAPTIWASELSIYALQFIVFLPIGVLVMDDTHIRVTLLADLFPARVRRVLRQVSLVGITLFGACLAWLGWQFTEHAWSYAQVSPTLLAVAALDPPRVHRPRRPVPRPQRTRRPARRPGARERGDRALAIDAWTRPPSLSWSGRSSACC